MTFIFGILRPLREKVLLAVMMGMGLLASAASIAKTFRAKDYGATGDVLMDSVQLTIWSILESQLACVIYLTLPIFFLYTHKFFLYFHIFPFPFSPGQPNNKPIPS